MMEENLVNQPQVLQRILKVIAGCVNTKREKYNDTLAFVDAVVKEIIDKKFPHHFLAQLLLKKTIEREEIENRKILRSSTDRSNANIIAMLNKTTDVALLGEYNSKTPIFLTNTLTPIRYRLLLSFGTEVTCAEQSLFSKSDIEKSDPDVLFSNIFQDIMDTINRLAVRERIDFRIEVPRGSSAGDLVVNLLRQIPDSLFVRMNLSLTFGTSDKNNYLSRLAAAITTLIKNMVEVKGSKAFAVFEYVKTLLDRDVNLECYTSVSRNTLASRGLRIFSLLSSARRENVDPDLQFKENLNNLDNTEQQLILMSFLMDAYAQVAGLANARNLILQFTQGYPLTAAYPVAAPSADTAAAAAATVPLYAESPRLSDFQSCSSDSLDRFTKLSKDFSHPSLVSEVQGVKSKLEIADLIWDEGVTEELVSHVQFFRVHIKTVIDTLTKLSFLLSHFVMINKQADSALMSGLLEAKLELSHVKEKLDTLLAQGLNKSDPLPIGSQSCPTFTTPGR